MKNLILSIVLFLAPSVFAFSQNYSGIGVAINKAESGSLTVNLVGENSPAQQSGIQKGDLITHIDGVSTKELSFQDCVSKIKGITGTKVKLTLERGSESMEVLVTRGTLSNQQLKNQAQEEGADITTCESGDCQNGTGKKTSSKGLIWEGSFKKGRLHGLGTFTNLIGTEYTGNFIEGRENGFFKLSFKTGKTVLVNYKDGFPESEGTVIFPNGERYEGEIDPQFSPHGKGVKTLADGEVLKGNFIRGNLATGCLSGDCQNGEGVFVEVISDRYEGEFLNGQKHGKGKWSDKYGNWYEGDFQQGEFHGKGKWMFSNGDFYEGDFRNGEYEGFGKFTWKDSHGKYYEGEFHEGHPEGKGTFVFKDGRVYKGQMTKNGMSGQGEFSWPNGDRYVGQFANDAINGIGTYYFSGGNRYEGEMVNSQIEGEGTYYFASGEKYVGSYQNGKKHGKGAFYFNNGDIKKGTFIEGELQYPFELHRDGKVTTIEESEFLAEAKSAYEVWKKKKAQEEKELKEYVQSSKNNYSTSSKTETCISGDCENGKGILVNSNGNRYSGSFKNGSLNGYGEISYADGSWYKGGWKDNLFHGQGEYYYKNNFHYNGGWSNGKMHGTGKIKYPEGDWSKGQFKYNYLEGNGEYHEGNGYYHSGRFEKGLLAYGTYYNPQGNAYAKFDGKKIIYLSSSSSGNYSQKEKETYINWEAQDYKRDQQISKAFGGILKKNSFGNSKYVEYKRW